jgi:TatD DNase family protein
MLAFIRNAPRWIPEVVATAVDMPGVDVEACRRFAEEAGVAFRVRKYQEVG